MGIFHNCILTIEFEQGQLDFVDDINMAAVCTLFKKPLKMILINLWITQNVWKVERIKVLAPYNRETYLFDNLHFRMLVTGIKDLNMHSYVRFRQSL